jgi:hypothetical protein
MLLCDDVSCNDPSHSAAIDKLYDDIVNCLVDAGNDLASSCKKGYKQILGWNEYCSEYHSEAREAFLLWRTNSNPRQGPLFDLMKRTRSHFKLTLRYCKSQEKRATSDSLAKKLLCKDSKAFWSEIKKINNTNCSIASTIDNVTGQRNIANMWQGYFKKLLNSSADSRRNNYVSDKLSDCSLTGNLITASEISSAIKELKCGKSCGLDELNSEHFKYASDKLVVYLTLVYNAMLTHGYIPEKFMLTLLVPIVKNKKVCITDSENYRPIAIATVTSKIVQIIILTNTNLILLLGITSLDAGLAII